MSCRPHRLRRGIALFACASAAASLARATTPSRANDCEVKPFDAFQAAVKRGWKFFCETKYAAPGGIAHTMLLPEPHRPVLCQWRTGLVPQPSPPIGSMRFFVRVGDANTLRNGWRIKTYEITCGQCFKSPAGNGARINAGSMALDRANRTLNFRLSKLVLNKSAGVCAKALDEAF